MTQLDRVFNQGTDEKLALVDAHEAEKRALQLAHVREIEALEAQFHDRVQALEAKHSSAERARVDELEHLRATSSEELQQTQAQAAADLARLQASAQAERDALETALQSEIEALRASSQAELDALRTTSQAELAALASESRAAYEALERSSNDEIQALREASATQFAAATDALKQELQALQQSNDSELEMLQSAHADERAQLIDQRERETAALRDELEASIAAFKAEIEQLKSQHAVERETTASASAETLRSLQRTHADALERLETTAATELARTVEMYESKLALAKATHGAEVERLTDDASAAQTQLVDKYETELTLARDGAKRERDLLTLAYETDIDALKRSHLEQLERATKAHEASAAQLRDAHAARTLQYESAAREHDKRFTETVEAKDRELEARATAIESLERQLAALTATHSSVVAESEQHRERSEMGRCERETRMLGVQQELCDALTALETTRRELRAAADDCVVKANTILELTFVIKSRDDEVERLRNALLDSLKSVNQKTEILELTAETLSSKAKELEDTKAALRKESGRLSRVEESMHHKDEILEDSELKLESLRLSMENLRLEMKRMQLDMKLQLEHSEGEMELKHGEISRLHAAQSELKTKNDGYQQTIARLEETLAHAQRQGDDAQRRIHLLRLEASQHADDAQKTRDALLARDEELLVVTNDKQAAVLERQRAQIQLNHLATVIASLRATRERELMLSEEIQTRLLRVLAETSAEKDERMRAEKHLLVLELSATKELVRHLDGVEARLTDAKHETERQRAQLQTANASVRDLEATVAQLREVETRYKHAQQQIRELQATASEHEHALACTHDKLRFESDAARASIAALSATVDELSAQHAALTHEHEDLETKHSALVSERDSLQTELAQQRARDAVLERQNDELTRALSGEKLGMADSVERMLGELSAAKAHFDEQLRDAAAKLTHADAERSELQQALDKALSDVVTLENSVVAAEAEARETSDKCAELTREVERLEHALQDESTGHVRDVQALEFDLQRKSEDVKRLEQALSALQEAHARVQQALADETLALKTQHELHIRELQDAHTQQLAGLEGATDEQRRLADDSVRALAAAEAERRELTDRHDAAVQALETAHRLALERLEQERDGLREQLAAAQTEKRALETMNVDALQELRERHAKELADAKAALAEDLAAQVAALTESTQREAELSRLRVAEEHLRKLEDVVESARVKDAQQLQALQDAQTAAAANTTQLMDATQALAQAQACTTQLEQRVQELETELDESQQLVIARTATIDNVRRGTRLETEASCANETALVAHSRRLACLFSELQLAHEASSERSAVQSSDQLLALVRQQLDAHLWTTWQVDRAQLAGSGSALETERDVVECLKDLYEIRCVALRAPAKKSGAASGTELVLSVSDVCKRLEDASDVARQLTEQQTQASETASQGELTSGSGPLAAQVKRLLSDHTRLLEHVQRVFRLDGSVSSSEFAEQQSREDRAGDRSAAEEPQSELDATLERLDVFSDALERLGLFETQQLRSHCDHVLRVLREHDELLVHAMKTAQGHETAPLTTLADFAALLNTVNDVLVRARGVTQQTERFQTPSDLHSLLEEFETLASGFDAAVTAPASAEPLPSSTGAADATLKTQEILDFVQRTSGFVATCREALGLTTAALNAAASAEEVVSSISELMKVLHCFDGFPSSPSRSSSRSSSASAPPRVEASGESSIQAQVASVLAFLDELHLMTDFAQSILDEESDATATPTESQSHASSSASLSAFESLTRSPTPQSELAHSSDRSDNDHSSSTNELLQIDVPLPLDELELELERDVDRDGDALDAGGDHTFFAVDDAGFLVERRPRASSPSPLAESLVDISLVMSDHHRILSEAAHWVQKTARLRRRSQTSRKLRRPADLGSEICLLVREHCALLSLAKSLFQLKDPRQDLASLLECLAILKRLTTRLPVFASSDVGDPSHEASRESLSSLSSSSAPSFAAASNTSSYESLRASLSVFACMESIARHLQDYDYLLQHLRESREKQWLSASVGNVELLTRDVTDRLELVALVQTQLGLANPLVELPRLLQSMQTLIARTQRLEPWKASLSTEGEAIGGESAFESPPPPSSSENLTGADTSGVESGHGELEEAKTVALSEETSVTEATVDLQGVEAYASAFETIERELAAYANLMTTLRHELPFAQSVDSVETLEQRVREVLGQLEAFANASVELTDDVARLRSENARLQEQQAQEDALLRSFADAATPLASSDQASSLVSDAASSRLETLVRLLHERQRWTSDICEAAASDAAETAFLQQNGLLPAQVSDSDVAGVDTSCGTGETEDAERLETPNARPKRLTSDTRLQIYAALLAQVQTSAEAARRLETQVAEQTRRLSESQAREVLDAMVTAVATAAPVDRTSSFSQTTAADESEREDELAALERLGLVRLLDREAKDTTNGAAAADHNGDGKDQASDAAPENNDDRLDALHSRHRSLSLADRLQLYTRLATLELETQAAHAALAHEQAFLEANQLAFDATDAAAARMRVYETLLAGQRALMDDKIERELELERAQRFADAHDMDASAVAHMDALESVVALQQQLAERDEADAMERAYLQENGLWRVEVGDDDAPLDAQEQFGVRIRVYSELLEARAVAASEAAQRTAAIEAEKAYLLAHAALEAGVAIDGPAYSRLGVYEQLLATQQEALKAQAREHEEVLRRLPETEDAFLRSHGLDRVLDAETEAAATALAIRMRIYDELLQRVCARDAAIAELEQARDVRESSLKVLQDALETHAAAHEREKLELLATIDSRDAELQQAHEQRAQDLTAESESYANELAVVTQRHADELERLQQAHAERLAALQAARQTELAAALEKQAKQLEFLVLVRANEEALGGGSGSASSPRHHRAATALSPVQARALLLDRVTKRDSSAISMIYRAIRLATDILNTSAFTGTSSSSGAAPEIPVEVTQAVLNCVKELKGLKEFLIESLEQLTRSDDAFTSPPPPFVRVSSNLSASDAASNSSSSLSGDKDAAIDFALCSHREFMAFAHTKLLKREAAMDAMLLELLKTLEAVAGGKPTTATADADTTTPAFTLDERRFMELEMERTREREARANVECERQLNDEYLTRLLNERKDVEATLTTALAELRDECKRLRGKVDTLEQERYAQPPGSAASSGAMYGLSPRASAVTPSYATASVMPMRPEKPREPPPSSRMAAMTMKGAGSVHKERFVSDLERETGQRRSSNASAATARRLNEWKKQDLLGSSSPSSQLERDFRALDNTSAYAPPAYGSGNTSPPFGRGRAGGGGDARVSTAASPPSHPIDHELWYQGVRSVHHVSFFVSLFFVPKQSMFRVEVFNSDTEQQQTVYVTWSEMETFVAESKRAARAGLTTLTDATRHAEVADVLFERVRVYGEGSANVLLGFE